MDRPISTEPRRVRPRSRWSLDVGSIARVPIRIHVTLLLLLAWIALSYILGGLGPSATIAGVALVVSVFVIVLLHELTHALMARRFGVRTRNILLLPIGGIASLERIPERPRQELAIALIGPVFNFVLAAVLWAAIVAFGGDLELDPATSLGEAIVVQLVWINIILGAFNLLPAFPLDGGRALRALLATRLSRERATQIAAGAGKLLAIALGVIGLFVNLWLVLIALVIWLGARAEVEQMQLRRALAGVPASSVMLRRIDVLDAGASLATAATLAVQGGSSALPMIADGRTVGVLTHRDLARGLEIAGPEASVSEVPHHQAVPIAPDESIERVLERLETDSDAIVVVVEDNGMPIGIVTPEQMASFAALHAEPRA